jgi:hypothetical protein
MVELPVSFHGTAFGENDDDDGDGDGMGEKRAWSADRQGRRLDASKQANKEQAPL